MKRLLPALVISCTTQWSAPHAITFDHSRPLRVCSRVAGDGVANAVAAWDRAIGGWRHVEMASGSCDVHVVYGECESKTAIACTESLGGSQITIQRSSHDTTGVVAHELGHALGAQHVPGTLMDLQNANKWDCPDATTVAQVAAYNRINLELLGWCWR